MGKNFTILILAFFISAVWTALGFGAPKTDRGLLPDGFVLAGVDGELSFQQDSKKWFFEFDSEVSYGKARLGIGAKLEVLPSSTLEKITTDVEKRSVVSYRLWGTVTKYQGKNFIFPIYFLPLSKATQLQVQTPEKSQSRQSRPAEKPNRPPEPVINEPEDAFAIPQHIIGKLTTSKIIQSAALSSEAQKGLELKADSILADRMGSIAKPSGNSKFKTQISKFIFDALGRNVPDISLRLLPCQALERAERKQAGQLEPLRFKIAGIVTRYKGENYLLLQRAARIYSHGNFAR